MKAIFIEFRNGLAIEIERLEISDKVHNPLFRKAIVPPVAPYLASINEYVVPAAHREEIWEMIAQPYGPDGVAFFVKKE